MGKKMGVRSTASRHKTKKRFRNPFLHTLQPIGSASPADPLFVSRGGFCPLWTQTATIRLILLYFLEPGVQ
jgi:hypothetical protein